MLNKAICKKCCNTRPTNHGLIRWNSEDEISWNLGTVRCPKATGIPAAFVYEPPPSHCPYALEHVVSDI